MCDFIVRLPMTSKDLRPNARVHWSIKAKITKRLRFNSSIAFRKDIPELRTKEFIPYDSVTIERRYYFKTRRRRDKDNMNASTKAINDGMVDSGLIADDDWDKVVWKDSTIVVDNELPAEYIEYRIYVK